MDGFDHDQLDAYRVALRFAAWAHAVAGSMPEGNGHLADQLRRASVSMVLNIAEGAGEFRPREKARFYRIASRSGTESAAVLDVLTVVGAMERQQRLEGRSLLLRFVSMAVRLVQTHQGSGAGSGTGTGTGTGTGRT